MRPMLASPIGEWQFGRYLIAGAQGIEATLGHTHAGLGMAPLWPICRRAPRSWSLTHLGSGHRVCLIYSPLPVAFALADKVADLGCWEFEGLHGWRNRHPNLPSQLTALMQAYPQLKRSKVSVGRSDIANEISYLRADA